MDWLDLISQISASTLRLAVPLLFAAIAGLICERSGVINIALEGFILIGAFFAAVGTLSLHSPWLGSLCAMLAGATVAVVYAMAVIGLKADQIVTGTAINLFALGVTPFLAKVLFDSSGSSASIPMNERFAYAPLVLAPIAVGLCYLWLAKSSGGLWLQFAGEHPQALDAAGIRVRRLRFYAVIASGAIAAFGGATLSIYLSSSFSRNMSAGRGFMALAAMIFGRWRPVPAALACLLFGFVDALQIRMQGVHIPGTEFMVPVQFVQIMPYVLTIAVLAFAGGHSGAPKALGRAFARGSS